MSSCSRFPNPPVKKFSSKRSLGDESKKLDRWNRWDRLKAFVIRSRFIVSIRVWWKYGNPFVHADLDSASPLSIFKREMLRRVEMLREANPHYAEGYVTHLINKLCKDLKKDD